MSKTKMRFKEDKFVNGELTYEKEKVYEIAEGSVERWLKRGGEVVDGNAKVEAPATEKPKEPAKTDGGDSNQSVLLEAGDLDEQFKEEEIVAICEKLGIAVAKGDTKDKIITDMLNGKEAIVLDSDSLHKLTNDQLHGVCDIVGVDYEANTVKDDLVNAILADDTDDL